MKQIRKEHVVVRPAHREVCSLKKILIFLCLKSVCL